MEDSASILACLLAAAVLVAPAQSSRAAPTRFPLGVTIDEGALVQPGEVLYTTRDTRLLVISQSGETSLELRIPERTILYAKPLPDGRILARLAIDGVGKTIAVVDQSGAIHAEIPAPEGVDFHHDHAMLSDGTVLVLCSRLIHRPEISDKPLSDDCLMRFDLDGNLLWEWQTADHFDAFDFPDVVKDGIFAAGGDWAHGNAAVPIPEDTGHTDPRFRPGNIIVSYRFISTVAIVDPATGDLVWTYDGTIGQHDSKMLPSSLPQSCPPTRQGGCNNILIFDNGLGDEYTAGRWRQYSRVIEVDPLTEKTVWAYNAELSGRSSWYFQSWFISGADRQKNGNTLITAGAFGRIFEVTREGRIVWEYVSPEIDLNRTPPDNQIYRAHKVPLGWVE